MTEAHGRRDRHVERFSSPCKPSEREKRDVVMRSSTSNRAASLPCQCVAVPCRHHGKAAWPKQPRYGTQSAERIRDVLDDVDHHYGVEQAF